MSWVLCEYTCLFCFDVHPGVSPLVLWSLCLACWRIAQFFSIFHSSSNALSLVVVYFIYLFFWARKLKSYSSCLHVLGDGMACVHCLVCTACVHCLALAPEDLKLKPKCLSLTKAAVWAFAVWQRWWCLGPFSCVKVQCETDDEDVGKKGRSQLTGCLLGWGLSAESPSMRTIGTIHRPHSAALGWATLLWFCRCMNAFPFAAMPGIEGAPWWFVMLNLTRPKKNRWLWLAQGCLPVSLGPLEISSCLLLKLKWSIFLRSVVEMKGWGCGSVDKQSCGIT